MSNSLLKKVTSAVVLTAMVASTVGAVSSTYAATTEVEAANALAGLGVIADQSSNVSAYRLGDTITRREMLKVMVNLAGVTVENKCEGKFADLPATDWGCKYAETALAQGFIAANTNFRPNDNVSKAEALKMVMKAKGIEKDASATSWEAAYVKAAVTAGLITASFSDYTSASKRGFTFTAAANATEEEDDLGLDDLLDGDDTTDDTTTTSTGETTSPIVKSGDLEVSLNPESATNGTTYPLGATAVSVAKYDLTAGSSDVTVDSVKLTRLGLGNSKDFEKVYLFVDGRKLTTGKTFSDSENQLTFSNVSLVVKAGSTETIDVRADIDTSTDGDANNPSNHSNSIQVTEVTSTAVNVSGTPLVSNTISIGAISVGSVDVEATANSKTAKVGEAQVELGKMTVYVSSTEDAEVKSITLYNNGKDVYANPKLYRGSTLVSEGELYGDYIRFAFTTPYEIKKWDNSVFTIKSDVVWEKDDVGKLYIRYKADVEVVGKTYGYNLAVADYDSDSDSFIDELDSISDTEDLDLTVEAGKLTLSFTGPSASDVPVDTDGVTLLEFTLTSETDVDVEKVGVDLGGAGLTLWTDATNLKLICDDSIKNEWSSPAASNTDTSIWSIKAGESKKCKVTLDIESTATLNDTVYATLDISDFIFKDNNGDTVTDIIPTADIEGKTMTVQNKTITISAASTPVSDDFVKGTQKVEVAGYVFAAGKASDVKVTDMTLTVDGQAADIGTAVQALTNVKVTGANGTLDSGESVYIDADTSGTVTAGDTLVSGSAVANTTALTALTNGKVTGANGTLDAGEFVYVAAGATVALADTRVTAVKGFAAGSVVGDYDGDGDSDANDSYAADAATSDISSVMLYVDGVQVGSTETISSSKVIFDNLSINVPAGSTKKVVAVANLANNAKYNKFSFDIAAATDVVAEDKDGKNVTNGSTVNSTAFVSIFQGGSLSVALDGDTADSEIVVAGTSDVEFTKIKFSAVDEEMTLNDFDVELDDITEANNVNQITAIAGSKTSTVDVAGWVAQFRDLGIVVPKDGSVVVTFKANLNTITAGADSGDDFSLDLDTANFEAIGVSGEKQTTISAVTGNNMTVRETKPTLAKATDSPSGTKAPGLDTVLKFTVTADAKEDVSLRGLNFKVIASGTDANINTDIDWVATLATSDFSLYEAGKESDELESANTDWTITELSDWNDTDKSFNLDISSATDYITVTKGTTKTFVLKLNTAGASASNDDTVRIDITSVDWNDSNATATADILPDVLPLEGNTIQY